MPPSHTQACVPVCASMCACTLSPWSSFVNRTMPSFATRLTQTQSYQSYSVFASVFKFCCWFVFIFVCGSEIEPRSLYMTDSCPTQAPFFFLKSSITSSGALTMYVQWPWWVLHVTYRSTEQEVTKLTRVHDVLLLLVFLSLFWNRISLWLQSCLAWICYVA